MAATVSDIKERKLTWGKWRAFITMDTITDGRSHHILLPFRTSHILLTCIDKSPPGRGIQPWEWPQHTESWEFRPFLCFAEFGEFVELLDLRGILSTTSGSTSSISGISCHHEKFNIYKTQTVFLKKQYETILLFMSSRETALSVKDLIKL